jgi:hypothetical protein
MAIEAQTPDSYGGIQGGRDAIAKRQAFVRRSVSVRIGTPSDGG